MSCGGSRLKEVTHSCTEQVLSLEASIACRMHHTSEWCTKKYWLSYGGWSADQPPGSAHAPPDPAVQGLFNPGVRRGSRTSTPAHTTPALHMGSMSVPPPSALTLPLPSAPSRSEPSNESCAIAALQSALCTHETPIPYLHNNINYGGESRHVNYVRAIETEGLNIIFRLRTHGENAPSSASSANECAVRFTLTSAA